MKILLVGSNGQLGKELEKQLSKEGDLFSFSKGELDITKPEEVKKKINVINPHLIVNAAAYTDVEGAEINREMAFKINEDAVKNLALETRKNNAWLIHYSTDYVFDGKKDLPYDEEDSPKPINNYGTSKYFGEQAIQNSRCDHLIFRTSWVIGQYGTNFATKIINRILEGQTLNVVEDQIGTPTTPKLIAEITLKFIELIKQNKENLIGIYNLTANGFTSWHELAEVIYAEMYKRGLILGKTKKINPVVSSNINQKAKRPLNSRLSNDKISKLLNLDLPSWELAFHEELDIILNKMEKNLE